MASNAENHDISLAQVLAVTAATKPNPEDWRVETTSSAAQAMHESFVLVNDLMAGTDRIRKKASTYLPKMTAELSNSWSDRVNRSFLFSGYEDTVRRLAARPFNDKIKIAKDSPEEIQSFVKGVDREGRSLTDFGRDAMTNGIHHGITGILVEFTNAAGAQTGQDELGARPVWELVDFDRIVGFRLGARGDETVITQLRILTHTLMEVGDFGEVAVDQIKVYSRSPDDVVAWDIWARLSDSDEDYALVDGGTISLDYIPFEPFYTNQVAVMEGRPALRPLAEKNVEHLQSSSDQRNILHFVRSAILFRKGFKEDEIKKRVAIGPSRMHSSTSDKADMKYVEHSGKGIEAGHKDIQHIEAQMAVLGLEPLLQTNVGTRTATEKALESAEEISLMRSWVRSLEDALDRSLNITADWLGRDYESDVDVNDQFDVLSSEDLTVLQQAARDEHLTTRTLLNQFRTRGILPEDFDVEAEISELEELKKNTLLPDIGAPVPGPDDTNGPGGGSI